MAFEEVNSFCVPIILFTLTVLTTQFTHVVYKITEDNDTYGHHVGDEAIVKAGELFKKYLGDKKSRSA